MFFLALLYDSYAFGELSSLVFRFWMIWAASTYSSFAFSFGSVEHETKKKDGLITANIIKSRVSILCPLLGLTGLQLSKSPRNHKGPVLFRDPGPLLSSQSPSWSGPFILRFTLKIRSITLNLIPLGRLCQREFNDRGRVDPPDGMPSRNHPAPVAMLLIL